MEQNLPPSSQRRNFLLVILGGITLALASLISWPIWRYLSPRKGVGELEPVAVARKDLGTGQAVFFNFHGRPAVVVETSPGDFSAFSAICTHLGCVVKWVVADQEFLCPCHAGRYSKDGAVVSGPPPKPLETLPVALKGDQILIG